MRAGTQPSWRSPAPVTTDASAPQPFKTPLCVHRIVQRATTDSSDLLNRRKRPRAASEDLVPPRYVQLGYADVGVRPGVSRRPPRGCGEVVRLPPSAVADRLYRTLATAGRQVAGNPGTCRWWLNTSKGESARVTYQVPTFCSCARSAATGGAYGRVEPLPVIAEDEEQPVEDLGFVTVWLLAFKPRLAACHAAGKDRARPPVTAVYVQAIAMISVSFPMWSLPSS
jgi:hypothetical protein